MGTDFNEDTRVKIPAILTLTRLGYGYLSLKDVPNFPAGIENQSILETSLHSSAPEIDKKTNIFTGIFFKALKRLNPQIDEAVLKKHFSSLQTCLDNDDLGKEFYSLLTSQSGIKLIDFDNFSRNTLNVVTELPCGEEDDTFRPDITILVNGIPLAFIEVKKPNNREGVLAERNRINDRFKNRKFRRYINISQILLFSNNMEYEEGSEAMVSGTEPIQGAFYAASSKDKAFFNQFREEKDTHARLLGYVKDKDSEIENFILRDTNYTVLKHGSAEFQTNKSLTTPTNRAIISLFAPERLSDLLRFGIAYVNKADEEGREYLEKHIMRYPQFFASKAIQSALDKGVRKGIIWHTQGSGKTGLAYFNVHWLTQYFQKQKIIPKFYFIVDRIDLRTQAGTEFEGRGLKINAINTKEDFIKDLKKTSVISGHSGEREITVLNIHKFSEESRATTEKDYDVNTQRVYFIDEAHRSYNPKGSFLANLIQSDPNAIIISLTGTPLLGKGEVRIASTKIFGDYIHKYYYDQSIRDGYTLRLIREEIESSYKLNLKTIFENLKVREGDARLNMIYAHKNFCEPLLEYIVEDMGKSRIRHSDDTIGGMVVCQSSEQAEMLFAIFKEKYEAKTNNNHTPNSAILILHDVDDTETRKGNIKKFKNGKIDLVFVYNMLLTGFDAPRLKKLYLGRIVKEHNLLQTLTRVNRPYKDFRFGYVVDFADIKEEFDKTNRAYWKELQEDWGEDLEGYSRLFVSPEEIIADIESIKDAIWEYDTVNAENFQKEISEIQDKSQLLKIRKALHLAAELYNLIRLNGYDELLAKLDFKKLKTLLGEVERRIALINQRENLKENEEISGLLNEALEEAIFMFRKVGEGPLDLAANNFKDMLRKTRESMSGSMDKKDPVWITLKEEIERLLKNRNWEEADENDLKDGTRILTDIYSRIREINNKDRRLGNKYNDDPKYVRIHKELIRTNKLSAGERQVFEVLNAIKAATDLQLLNADILQNSGFFESFVQSIVVRQFNGSGIELDPDIAKLVKNVIVREYMNERQVA
jgi:type I restriction enzyme R subunit